MTSHRLLGPPLAALFGVGIAAAFIVAQVIWYSGPRSIAIAVIAAVAAWRFLVIAVHARGHELVVTNVLGTERWPLDEVYLGPRLSDVRKDAIGYARLPHERMEDDNSTIYAWRWVLRRKDSSEHLNIDALLGRSNANHQAQALLLQDNIERLRER
jgi:hypothetical protein